MDCLVEPRSIKRRKEEGWRSIDLAGKELHRGSLGNRRGSSRRIRLALGINGDLFTKVRTCPLPIWTHLTVVSATRERCHPNSFDIRPGESRASGSSTAFTYRTVSRPLVAPGRNQSRVFFPRRPLAAKSCPPIPFQSKTPTAFCLHIFNRTFDAN